MKNYFKITFLCGSLLFANTSASIAVANEIENNKVITSEKFYLNAHKIFSLADTDLDLKLSKAEIMNFRQKKRIERAERDFNQMDQDKNGVLSIDEWKSQAIDFNLKRNISQRSNFKTSENRPAALGRDLNSDGFISLEEHNISMRSNFLKMDTNSDGVLTRHDRFRHHPRNKLK